MLFLPILTQKSFKNQMFCMNIISTTHIFFFYILLLYIIIYFFTNCILRIHFKIQTFWHLTLFSPHLNNFVWILYWQHIYFFKKFFFINCNSKSPLKKTFFSSFKQCCMDMILTTPIFFSNNVSSQVVT